MTSLIQGPKQSSSAVFRSNGIKRILISMVIIFLVITMVLVYSNDQLPTIYYVPPKVVPIHQIYSSNVSPDVGGSSFTVSSQKASFSTVNRSFPSNVTSPAVASNSTAEIMKHNQTDSTTEQKLEGNEDNVTAVSKHVITTNSELSKVCNTVKLMPVRSMPVIALASLPGSGNTWLRHLIERVTGIYTGSIYNDNTLRQGGFLGESYPPYSGRTVAVKMHMIDEPLKIKKTIFLVRNLYDSLLAEFNRKSGNKRKNHTGIIKESLYKTEAWPTCVKNMLITWQKLVFKIKNNFRSKDKLLVVDYQDLKTDLRNQLRRIVDFLGLPLDEERLECTLHQAEGNFHRPKHTLSFNPFNANLISRVEKAITVTNRLWKKSNLPPLLLKNDLSTINDKISK